MRVFAVFSLSYTHHSDGGVLSLSYREESLSYREESLSYRECLLTLIHTPLPSSTRLL